VLSSNGTLVLSSNGTLVLSSNATQVRLFRRKWLLSSSLYHESVNCRQTLSSSSFGNLQKNTSRLFKRFVLIYLHHPVKTSRDNAKTRQVHHVNNSSS